MKKRNSILIVAIIFTSFILSSCGGSVKGKWSEADKLKFNEAIAKADLSAYGENKAKWTECYLGKLEANYSSFAEADNDRVGCPKYAAECIDLIMANGSVKGKWSDSDKQKFTEAMESADLSKLGGDKAKWIECYLKKAEATYSSFYAADRDAEGCTVIAKECNEEIIK